MINAVFDIKGTPITVFLFYISAVEYDDVLSELATSQFSALIYTFVILVSIAYVFLIS